jgi:RNA-directed DNA polymerase
MRGQPNCRLVRFADDWCLAVAGTRADAEALREQIAVVLSGMGLHLSSEKTLITHIDEGLDFLGWRIQRHRKPGTNRYYVYTYPAKKALRAVTAKVKTVCRTTGASQPLDVLLDRLTPALRGWCAYFRPGVSSASFGYLHHYTWHRVWRWIRSKHPKTAWRTLLRRYGDAGGWPTTEAQRLFDPATVSTTRYRYRGSKIPPPWPVTG